MSLLDVICVVLAGVSLVAGGACVYQLYRWERALTGVRVLVHFKGKTAMTPRLIDWLHWSFRLDADKEVNGQVIYKLGGTTIALKKPLPRAHGKTKRRTIKGDPHS